MKTNKEYTAEMFKIIARQAIDGEQDPRASAKIIRHYAQEIIEMAEQEAREGQGLADLYPNLDKELI